MNEEEYLSFVKKAAKPSAQGEVLSDLQYNMSRTLIQ